MKAAQSNSSKALNFLGKTILAIAVSPLLPVIGLMWLVSIMDRRNSDSQKHSATQKQSESKRMSRSLYAERSNPALEITWTGDTFLNGY